MGKPIFFFLILLSQLGARTYQIDTQADFDRHRTGTFAPGDEILFRSGGIFSGMFAPRGSGRASEPIVIDRYGTGEMPIINALGEEEAGIFLKNVQFWEVQNIEITNTDGSQRHQGKLKGIYVLIDADRPQRTMRHIYIKDCFVHDVNGRTRDNDPDGAKRHGGIHVHTYGSRDTLIDDLQIVGNTVQKTGGVGIATDSDHNAVQNGDVANLWTKVYIAHNYVDNTDRNNMIVRDSVNAIAEYNTLANSSRENTGHSIFNFHTVGFVAQHNEAYGNVGDESKDRGGYDADYNARDTTYQYNYSHDNIWFCGVMKRWNKGVTIRYNISQNDRGGFCFYGFNSSRECEDVVFHNNVYFLARRFPRAPFIAENRTPLNTSFYNNIFYYENEGFFNSAVNGAPNTSFSHNLYFGIPARGDDNNAVTANPQFVSAGSGGRDLDMTDPNRLSGYRLSAGSPCIDAGRVIPGVTRDFWGNPVPSSGAPDIGVHERQAAATTLAPTYGNGGIPGSGRPWLISGETETRLEAENFDQGGSGVGYLDSDSVNQGAVYRLEGGVDIQTNPEPLEGFNVGWTAAGEWLQFSIEVEERGLFDLRFRHARSAEGAVDLRVVSDGNDLAPGLELASTGGWEAYVVANAQVQLDAGPQVLRVFFPEGGINLDYFEFAPASLPEIVMVEVGPLAESAAGETWSDGLPAHSGAVYRVPNGGQLRSESGSSVFPGFSLVVEPGGRFQFRSVEANNEVTVVDDLVLEGGSDASSSQRAGLQAGTGSSVTNVLDGTIRASGFVQFLTFENASGSRIAREMKVHSQIRGEGTIQAWEGIAGQGGSVVTITNEDNTFAGT